MYTPDKEFDDVEYILYGKNHCIFLTKKGEVFTWGCNAFGQLGIGSTTSESKPVKVTGLTEPVRAIGSECNHCLALCSNGTLMAWGDNIYGQLGDKTNSDRTTPIVVKLPYSDTWDNDFDQESSFTIDDSCTDDTVCAFSCGRYHTSVLTTNGKVWTFGDNDFGQLGNDSTIPRSSIPVEVPFEVKVVAIYCGSAHTAVLTADGEVFTWGSNNFGQLGNGETNDKFYPVKVMNLDSPIVAIACGLYHTVALTTCGKVFTWGYNNFGQLGYDTPTSVSKTPKEIMGISCQVATISCNSASTTIMTLDGEVVTWG